MKRIRFLQAAAACLAAPLVGTARAQAYPDRPVRIVAPFEAGGATDILARLLAEDMSQQFGKSVIVENKAGANGIIGTEFVTKAKPDGYTLMYVSSSVAINPSVYSKLPYDTLRDLLPVGELARVQGYLILVPAAMPVSNLRDFVALAKNPNSKLAYSMPGIGNPSHLAAEFFLNATGGKAVAVPYKSSGAAVLALAAGDVQMSIQAASVALPQIQSGKIKALAFTGRKRLPGMPDIPTIVEAGYPDLTIDWSWQGVFAPAGTPADVVSRINKAIVAARRNPKIVQSMDSGGFEAGRTENEAEFRSFFTTEVNRYGDITRIAKIEKISS